MSSEKFESLEDDLSAILDEVKAKERKITGCGGGMRNLFIYEAVKYYSESKYNSIYKYSLDDHLFDVC